VTRDVAPGSVVAGVPAKKIKDLDSYWEGVSQKAVYIRALPKQEKKNYLEKLFNLK
jgi:hypothetical protein